jgi:UDP-N-acetylglucosamine 2-epimerase
LSGDVMLEATRFYAGRAAERAPLERLTEHRPGAYFLATVHRAENTDQAERLSGIFRAFGSLGAPVLVPLHPRTRARLRGVEVPTGVHLMEPASYLAMLTLVKNARCVLTDSGGLQKEALWLGTPCVTLREETEWVETLEGGWNQIAGADPGRIVAAARRAPTTPWPDPGDGAASGHIVALLRGEREGRTE